MIDHKTLKNNPDIIKDSLKARGASLDLYEKAAAAQQKYLASTTHMQEFQHQLKVQSQEFGNAKRNGTDTTAISEVISGLKSKLEIQQLHENVMKAEFHDLISRIPNTLDKDVPHGLDENDNAEIEKWGEIRQIENPLDHVALGENMGLMDFETAANMSGSRFVILKGKLARLERALGNFMIDHHTNYGKYTEVSAPLLVKAPALFGTGQLPKFEEDLFKAGEHYLIPTSEVSLTNTVAGKLLQPSDLPIRLTALTHCFRAEAGSAGRDTRGMIRQHQFQKVELVSIVTPNKSEDEHTRMLVCAESILKALELPYRIMMLCSGDIGFSARKTYDLEVWLPSQKRYREISSISNCGDFQARRMNTRVKIDGQNEYVHTLNGSGLAVGRTLLAIMENYQISENDFEIPAALKPYL